MGFSYKCLFTNECLFPKISKKHVAVTLRVESLIMESFCVESVGDNAHAVTQQQIGETLAETARTVAVWFGFSGNFS